jgi:putative copper resistance protein D
MLYALAGCQFVHFAAVMLLFGGSAVREILKGERHGWSNTIDSRLFRLLLPVAVIALLSAGAWLLLVGAEMGGPWADAIRPRIIRIVLTDTRFGHVWSGRLALALAICVIVWRVRRAPAAITVLSAVLLASLATTGHSVMHTGWLGVAHQVNQAVHLLAAGFWLGGLIPLALLLATSETRPPDRLARARALRQFSDVAIVAVVLVLATGLVNAWMLVGDPSALIETDYGNTLVVKLVMVAAIVAVAIVNRLVMLPALAADGAAALARIERNVKLEIVLGALIVAAASVLGNLPPPAM